MFKLKILADSPKWKSYFSIMFPFYRWEKQLKEQGIDLQIIYDHNDKNLHNGDATILVSRYFNYGWQNISKRTPENEAELINLLISLKKSTNKLIWFDTGDSTGTTDFPIISYVDIFLKKQILKDLNYYTEQHGSKSVRVWLNDTPVHSDFSKYFPCPQNELHKIKVSCNLGYCDHRYFWPKCHVISNYLPAGPKFTKVDINRDYDLTFRGHINYDGKNAISFQRNLVLNKLKSINLNVITGSYVKRKIFLHELNTSKVCVSPFGWGEICSRDFESFLAGCILLKPSMDHSITFPNIFIENETYIPLKWDMSDFEEKISYAIDNYKNTKEIAINGQNNYLSLVNNPDIFINHIKNII
jgi:hypothetical protein